jgi:hypothetical protein
MTLCLDSDVVSNGDKYKFNAYRKHLTCTARSLFFLSTGCLQEGWCDVRQQHITVNRVQHRSKAFRVHLSGLAVGLIQYILLVYAKRCRFTCPSESFQFVASSICKVYLPVERTSGRALVKSFRTWQHDRPWSPCKKVRNKNREAGAFRLYKEACQ